MMDLFSPLDIRKVHFKNRAVMAPMVLNCAGEDGSVTPAFQDFYAARARQAGFDAVELHACHDYWLNYFLSPYFNHRIDEYGGCLDNRFRLLRETTEEVLAAVGGEILVGVRLSMADFVDGGLGLDETLEIGRHLEAIGVDYLSASAGIGLTQFRMSPPSDVPRGRLLVFGRARSIVEAIGEGLDAAMNIGN